MKSFGIPTAARERGSRLKVRVGIVSIVTPPLSLFGRKCPNVRSAIFDPKRRDHDRASRVEPCIRTPDIRQGCFFISQTTRKKRRRKE